MQFSDVTLAALTRAGWTPERDVTPQLKLPEGFAIFPAAHEILKRFAYLKLRSKDPRPSIYFDPMLAQGEDDRFQEYANILGASLYPLGEMLNWPYFLAVDEHGRIFALMDEFLFINQTFVEALDNLLTGFQAKVIDEHGSW